MINELNLNDMKNTNIIDKNQIKPIVWGNSCHSWSLIDKQNMGIFHEIMPHDTTDKLHVHHSSEQFIYVLNGKVGVELNNETFYLTACQGISIPKEIPHRVFNDSNKEAEFILFASPNHENDRIEVA